MQEETKQLTLADLDSSFRKMYQEHFLQPKEKTSKRCLKKPLELCQATYQFLDLRVGRGNLLGPYWEKNSLLLGEYSMLDTGESPREDIESFLWQILEDRPHLKYYLSKTACLGILRRMGKNKRELPESFQAALDIQGELKKAEEVIEIIENREESFWCVNRQGGSSYTITDNMTNTLTASMAGSAPCVIDIYRGTKQDSIGGEKGNKLIRNLTPLECERLQGFPDYWTKISNAKDSPRYKALGNSVAIPCVTYLMRGIAGVLEGQKYLGEQLYH